jgi:E3 ubiquitin-protein ligase EDD1
VDFVLRLVGLIVFVEPCTLNTVRGVVGVGMRFMCVLLFYRDAQGLTPFMLAVTSRAYAAALTLLDTIQRVANKETASPPPTPLAVPSSLPTSEPQTAGVPSISESSQQQRKACAVAAMVYPVGSSPDDSPLHVVCCNDTCSFTWTGAEHINQVRTLIVFVLN